MAQATFATFTSSGVITSMRLWKSGTRDKMNSEYSSIASASQPSTIVSNASTAISSAVSCCANVSNGGDIAIFIIFLSCWWSFVFLVVAINPPLRALGRAPPCTETWATSCAGTAHRDRRGTSSRWSFGRRCEVDGLFAVRRTRPRLLAGFFVDHVYEIVDRRDHGFDFADGHSVAS